MVYFKGEQDGITVEAAFQYTNEFHENILGFCNNIFNAEGGTHITGFKTVFTTVINSYARELGILKEKDSNFTGADVRNGMTAIVSIKHPDPRFEGQTKTKLDNQDASRVTAKVTGDEIQLYFDKNLEVLKTVISCAEKAAKIRKTEERAKTNLLTKQNSLLIPTESLQTVRAGTRRSVRYLSSREILRVVPQRRRVTVIFRQSCRSVVRF